MCIYCGTKKYRKIYENHYGTIPVDESGRSYDIHHIDGNHNNNHPSNLKAITVQEHYDIHYAQGNYGACYYIKIQRLSSTKEEISEIASIVANHRVESGTHPWKDKERMRKQNQKRTAEGKNPFSNPDIVKKQFENMQHVTQKRVSCLGCRKETYVLSLNRWHEKCSRQE
jgi:hypothetical protein